MLGHTLCPCIQSSIECVYLKLSNSLSRPSIYRLFHPSSNEATSPIPFGYSHAFFSRCNIDSLLCDYGFGLAWKWSNGHHDRQHDNKQTGSPCNAVQRPTMGNYNLSGFTFPSCRFLHIEPMPNKEFRLPTKKRKMVFSFGVSVLWFCISF